MARNDEKLYTERDLVMAKRAAFRDGVNYAAEAGVKPHESPDGPCWYCDRKAEKLYPLPKVTRPRVVRDASWDVVEWKSDGCNIYWRHTTLSHDWVRYPNRIEGHLAWPEKERVRLWADLLASPCEEVEDDS